MTRLLLSPAATVTETRLGVVVRSDLAALHLKGNDGRAVVEDVLPLFDGTRDLAEVQRALPRYSALSVARVHDALVARGLLVDAGAAEVDPRLAAARVRVVGDAPFVDIVMDALRGAGVGGVARLDPSADIDASLMVVIACRPVRASAIKRISTRAHRAGVPSLWAEIRGRRAILGPLVHPGRTACRVCTSEDVLNPACDLAGGQDVNDNPGSMFGEMVATIALQHLTGTPSRFGGRVLVQDLEAWGSSWRTIVRVPWCPVCG